MQIMTYCLPENITDCGLQPTAGAAKPDFGEANNLLRAEMRTDVGALSLNRHYGEGERTRLSEEFWIRFDTVGYILLPSSPSNLPFIVGSPTQTKARMGPVDSSLLACVSGAIGGYPDVRITSPTVPKTPEVVHKVSVRVSYDSSQL